MRKPRLDGGGGRPSPHDRIVLHAGRNRWLFGLVLLVLATVPVALFLVFVGELGAAAVYAIMAVGAAAMVEGHAEVAR